MTKTGRKRVAARKQSKKEKRKEIEKESIKTCIVFSNFKVEMQR
jgi:hypothetical protein